MSAVGAVVIAGAIVIAIFYAAFRLRAFLLACWFLVQLWRWLSGEPHHGHPITNAGWTRRGYGPALTPTKHAGSWWYRPRWQRAAHRTGGTFGVFALVLGVITAPLLTLGFVIFVVLVFLALLVRRIGRVLAARVERKTWLHPLHLAAHELAGHPRAVAARSWITTELDSAGAVKSAELKLTQGWPADEKDKQRLVSIASQKLGMESAEPKWRLAGPAPLLRLVHSPPPPGHVNMADLLPELAKCKRDEFIIGVGKNDELIRASLVGDSPHLAISMGTGAGKSNLAGWLLLQELLRGGIGLVLDPKQRLSYPWILKDEHGKLAPLPNIAYAWTTAQLHASMAWLPTELDRRGKVAFSGMDARGVVRANVGSRLFTLAEELNLAIPRLRMHWQENRGPGDPTKSPALTGIGEVAFAGRVILMNLVLIGQMLTAEVTGSRDSSVKEQCGVKMLSRYGPKGWRMMAEDIPMPPPPSTVGRIQVVSNGTARETQTPEIDGVHARELVLASDMALLPYDIPCRPVHAPEPATIAAGRVPTGASDLGVQSISVAPTHELVSLKEAIRRGHLHPSTTLSSLEMGRYRDPSFPARKDIRGREYLYDESDLAAYDEARRS